MGYPDNVVTYFAVKYVFNLILHGNMVNFNTFSWYFTCDCLQIGDLAYFWRYEFGTLNRRITAKNIEVYILNTTPIVK